MPDPLLEQVFKTNGVPTYTFVEPREWSRLLGNLRSPGRGLVIEGPSGIGKTTAVEKALEHLGMAASVAKLSARRPKDVELIRTLPEITRGGTVIIDDFHKLGGDVRAGLADYMKTLADEESRDTKIIAVGINKAGQNLIQFAHDLVNRLDVVAFENNPDEKVRELVTLGERALHVELNVAEEIVTAAQGSFYVAQMLCLEVCRAAGVAERGVDKIRTAVSFEGIRGAVWERLATVFLERTSRFCRGTKMKREGRAPYLHVLRWLAEGTSWTLSLRDAMRQYPNMRGSVGQIVDKNYLKDLVFGDDEIQAVMHYDDGAEQLTVEDPQFIFFIRNIPWRKFATDVGFMAVEFPHRYDFALSFQGEDRDIAELLFKRLEEYEVEIFYDKNEQHRILARDVEEYLRPIYQSEAQFVVVLLGEAYPKKIWTKVESDAFKSRLGQDAVVPIWFADVPPTAFDTTRNVGGITIDRAKSLAPQIDEIAKLLTKKLGESRKR